MNGKKGRPTILVVEDDAAVLRMLNRLLAEVADVTTARDGVEAMEAVIGGLAPNLVITDVMMPRMDGLALVQKLKEHRPTAHVPVIMLTAKQTPKDVIAGINAGARSYLTKPFKQEELLAKVKKALKR